MTTKQLIDRQLGPIDEENACTRESSKLTDCNVFNPKLAVYILDVEQSRRELLERMLCRLLEERRTLIAVGNPMIKNNEKHFFNCNITDIELIETILGLLWEEIIKALED